MTETTGLVIKRHQGVERLSDARLRQVGHDHEGYFLKVDLDDQDGRAVQIYLYLDELDVDQVVEGWGQSGDPTA